LLIISEPNYKLYNSILWRIRSSNRLRKIFSSIGLKTRLTETAKKLKSSKVSFAFMRLVC